jgi:hypothetical protein
MQKYYRGGIAMMPNGMNMCKMMESTGSCDNCGEYNKWRPCNVVIPKYIPEEQIKKWLMARRSENV